MQTLSNLIDNKQLLDFSQNFGVTRAAYMGSRLFPDVKTQYLEAEYTRLCENGNLPMVAMVHGFDTEAHIGSRIPFEKVSHEELLIKEKINLTEKIRKITNGMNMEVDTLRSYIYDDVARMAERVVVRAELAKMEAITEGKMIIEENGLSLVVDYRVPSDNFKMTDWDDPDADIIGDVRGWYLDALAKGYAPSVAFTTEAVVTKIMRNAAIQKAIFGAAGAGILPSLDQINTLFRAQFSGLYIETNEQRYGEVVTEDEKAKVVQHRFFKENKFVMASTGLNGSVGTGLWGVTPEEEATGGAFDTKRQQQYVTVTTWDTPDPVATWTKASGLFIPVLPNPYGHIIADVATATSAPADAGSEG